MKVSTLASAILEKLDSLNRGESIVEGFGKSGIIASVASLSGLLTTQNLMWLAGSIFALATLCMQLWFQWYKQKQMTKYDLAAYKAKIIKDLRAAQIDISDVPALQHSPDPDL